MNDGKTRHVGTMRPTEGILFISPTLANAQITIVLPNPSEDGIAEALIHGYCERIVASDVQIHEEGFVVLV